MKRKPLVAGNWKMNGTLAEAKRLAQAVAKSLAGFKEVEILLLPPFTALSQVKEILQGTPLGLGAQDLYWEPQGAFTGEISAPLLQDAGCQAVLIGHSERRHILGETDGVIQRKLKAALEQGLCGILCVGETLEERKKGQTWKVVERQLTSALETLEPLKLAQKLVVAYEPVWAIGTGLNATALAAQEVHGLIRQWLGRRIGSSAAGTIRILYGGSVKPENAGELMAQPDLDGLLVGGASLNAKSFVAIVETARQVKGSLCCTESS